MKPGITEFRDMLGTATVFFDKRRKIEIQRDRDPLARCRFLRSGILEVTL